TLRKRPKFRQKHRRTPLIFIGRRIQQFAKRRRSRRRCGFYVGVHLTTSHLRGPGGIRAAPAPLGARGGGLRSFDVGEDASAKPARERPDEVSRPIDL